jgi:hypothetical protein
MKSSSWRIARTPRAEPAALSAAGTPSFGHRLLICLDEVIYDL